MPIRASGSARSGTDGSSALVPQADVTGGVNGQGTPISSFPFANGIPSKTLRRVPIKQSRAGSRIRPTNSRINRVRFSSDPPYLPGRLRAASSSFRR